MRSRLARALGSDALVGELARRAAEPGDMDVVADLVARLSTDQVGRLVGATERYGRLDYPGSEIELVISSQKTRTRLRSCKKEPFTVSWLERFMGPAEVFYDVGANVGAYSLIAARLGGGTGRVFAFEPGAPTYYDLCRNIAHNGCDGVVAPLPLALTDATSLATFGYRSLVPGAARHSLGGEGRAVASQLIPAMRLDDAVASFALPPPTMVKIDVDGAELDVLAGGVETLARQTCRAVLTEVDPPQEHDVVERLASLGYVPDERHTRDREDSIVYRSFIREGL